MLRHSLCRRVGINGAAGVTSSSSDRPTGFFATLRGLMAWNKANAVVAADGPTTATTAAAAASTPSASVSSSSSADKPEKGGSMCNMKFATALDAVEAATTARWSCRHFDPSKPIDVTTLQRVLAAATRAPTGFNLQGWYAVVVTDPRLKEQLYAAALCQPQVLHAPATVVFIGETEPEANAPQALEMGLESGYYHPLYGSTYLRNVYYFMHGGPMQTMAAAKSALSAWYSQATGTALVSVPVSRVGYAWKQTMIPATTFMQLATAAGWDSCVMEGIDEEAVKRALKVPARCTVPVLISVGYATTTAQERAKTRSSRFATSHLIRWNKF